MKQAFHKFQSGQTDISPLEILDYIIKYINISLTQSLKSFCSRFLPLEAIKLNSAIVLFLNVYGTLIS